jgi:endonuclease/exonuclease/phosphatase (EEP) superfamily protein YafD
LGGAGHHWWIWIAVVPLAAWAIVRTFGLEGDGLLVALLAFTPYAAIVALLVFGVAVALGNWPASAVAALATVCLAAAVLPRTIGDGTVAAAGRETLDVLSANLHRGTSDPAELVALVERLHPDLLSLQELPPSYVQRLRAAGIARLLPRTVFVGDPTRPELPGLGVYSRLPLSHWGPKNLHALGAAVRMPSGREVRVVDVHPHTPQPGYVDKWRVSLDGLPSAGTGVPVLLVGDFNATLDQAELRGVVDRGYRDAGAVAGKGLEPTFPQEPRLIPPVTIDHVLADRRLGVVEYSVVDQPGSDHRAIHAVLVLP